MTKNMSIINKQCVLMFTGQGSQKIGMLNGLKNLWPSIIRNVMEETNEALQLNLENIIQDGPSHVLTNTKYAQPAILAYSYCLLQILKNEIGFQVSSENTSIAMGHSLGEYSALVATKSLNFDEAIKIVHFRGKLMQSTLQGSGAQGRMAALMPISERDAQAITTQASIETGKVCEIAAINSNQQIVISGNVNAIQVAISIAKQRKDIKRVVELDVSAPFHCQLMKPAAMQLCSRLKSVEITFPCIPLISNVTAQPVSNTAQIKSLLVDQVTSTIQWKKCVEYCIQERNQKFVEIGPGNTLYGLVRQINPMVSCRKLSCRSLGTVSGLLEFLKEYPCEE